MVFAFLLPGWIASPDEQIVSQFHMGDVTIAFNPLFAISVQGSGLRFQARFNNNKQMSKAGTSKPVDVASDGLPVSAWTYIVIRARISPNPDVRPYLQVWRDGIEIISYTGPLGYDIPGTSPYAKRATTIGSMRAIRGSPNSQSHSIDPNADLPIQECAKHQCRRCSLHTPMH